MQTAMVPAARPSWMDVMEQASQDLAAAEPLLVLDAKAANMRSDLSIEEALTGHGGWSTNSGVDVGPESALHVTTVFACRRVIAEDIAKMPRLLKQRTKDRNGRIRHRVVEPNEHPVSRILQIEPCAWLTPFQFWEWLVGCAVLHRAAYALPTWYDGQIQELLPLPPGSVTVHQRSDWDVEYHVNTGHGTSLVAGPSQILQLTGPLDSTRLQGYAVSALAREAIGLAIALEGAVARFHKNDMRPAGVLTTDAKITKEQRDSIASEWKRRYGAGGDGGIAVLDAAFKFAAMTATSADSQTKENRELQISEICRAFRVFPQLVMHSGNLQGYGSFEQAMNNHVTITLIPWVERVEQAAMKALLTREEREQGYYIQIDADATMRGTFTDRVNAYEKAVKVFMTPNQVLEREGMDQSEDPNMDKVQLQANNTGLMPGAGKTPADAGAKPAGAGKQPEATP